VLLVISMEVYLEVNTGKIKHVLSHEQNTDQNHDINTGNKAFERVTKFRYYRNTPTNQNCLQEETRS